MGVLDTFPLHGPVVLVTGAASGLALAASSYMTGTIVAVDGGWLAW